MICTLCHAGIGTDYADDTQYGIVHGQCYERIAMKRIKQTMTDPNAIYKARFRELTALLGRPPVSTDSGWVEMHEEYKRAWGPAEETVRAPRAREMETWTNAETATRVSSTLSPTESGFIQTEASLPAPDDLTTANANTSARATRRLNTSTDEDSAAGPLETGFSRKPAPQARAIQASSTREGVPDLMAALQRSLGMDEPLSGPGAIQTEARGASEPNGASGPPRIDERARGASGGVLAVCEGCGEVWEREKRRGRPALLCIACR